MKEQQIELKPENALAKGTSRLVFQHPNESALLIKVIRPDVIEQRFGSGTKWYKRFRRLGRYLSYLREIQEFLAVHNSLNQAPRFLQRIVGFTETNLGLGLVIEGVFSKDGSLAPSLLDLIKAHRYSLKIAEALEDCFREILASRVVISDLNVGNFVYLENQNRIVMIDGMGNANPLGLKGISETLNRRSKIARFERFRTRIERHLRQRNHPPLESND